jgi:hypothetical protein
VSIVPAQARRRSQPGDVTASGGRRVLTQIRVVHAPAGVEQS